MLKRRTQQRIVDRQQRPLRMTPDRIGSLLNVGHRERGIRGSLDEHQLQIGGFLDGFAQ